MKVEFKNDNIVIDNQPHEINLNYDRCFGKVIRKYNADVDENIDFGDLNSYGLRTILVFEILKKSDSCSDKIQTGDLVVVNAGHLVQVNISLNFMIDSMGDEYAVIPEDLMMFKVNEDESEIDLLIEQMVRVKYDDVINTEETEFFELMKKYKSQFKIYEILDDNNHEDFKKGEKYIVDMRTVKNLFPVKNDEYLLTVNNFKIRVKQPN